MNAAAGSATVHRDVSAAFYRAVPPRPVPWRKRLFWRLLFAFVATGPGARLLTRRAD